VELVDTAGIRRALSEAESIGIKKSMEALADADLVLVVIDKSQPLSEEDQELLTQVEGRPAIVVENKSDLLADREESLCGDGRLARPSRADPGSSLGEDYAFSPSFVAAPEGRPTLAQRFSAGGAGKDNQVPEGRPTRQVISTSALTGKGIPALRAAILNHVAGDFTTTQESGFLTSLRHQKLVNDAQSALEAATNAVAAQVPHEMLLLDLYGALRPLDEITGVTTTDDILDLIFRTFCIGK
jgi:tRNA modification GTPase